MEEDEEILLRDYLSSLQSENQEYSEKVNAIKSELEKQPDFIKKSEIKAQETRTRLENQYIDLERSANELDLSIKRITDEVNNLQKSKIKMESDLLKYNQSICDAKTKINIGREDIISLVDEFTKITIETQATDKEISNIITEIEKDRLETDDILEKNKILEEEVKKTQVMHKTGPLKRAYQFCVTEHSKNAITSMILGQLSNSVVLCTNDCKVTEIMIDAHSQSVHSKLPAVPNSIKRYPSMNQSAIAFNNGIIGLLDHGNFKFKSPLAHRCIENAMDVDWISKTRIIATSQDRSMRIFDFARSDSISVVKTPFQPVTLCRGSTLIICGGMDGTVAMFDPKDSSITNKTRFVQSSTIKVASPAIGPAVLSLHSDGSLLCLDERNPSSPLFLVETGLPTKGGCLAVSPLSQITTVCGANGHLKQYTSEGELLRETRICEGAISHCTSAENAIVLVHDSQIVDIWTTSN